MQSRALESHMYGDPMEVASAKQQRERRRSAEKAAVPEIKRLTLTLKRKSSDEWSEARKAAEALFNIPAGAGALSAVPCPTPSAKRVDPE